MSVMILCFSVAYIPNRESSFMIRLEPVQRVTYNFECNEIPNEIEAPHYGDAYPKLIPKEVFHYAGEIVEAALDHALDEQLTAPINER